MANDSEIKIEPPTAKKPKTTTYPGKNDGRISASKHANMRSGASRPAPKK